MNFLISRTNDKLKWFQDGDSDEDDSDDEDDDEGEETALEGFTTPLDEEEGPDYIDEYLIFSDVMRGKIATLNLRNLITVKSYS